MTSRTSSSSLARAVAKAVESLIDDAPAPTTATTTATATTTTTTAASSTRSGSPSDSASSASSSCGDASSCGVTDTDTEGSDQPSVDAAAHRRTVYDHVTRKGSSIAEYLARWKKYSQAGDAVLIQAVIYLDRICSAASIGVTGLNVHNLLLVSLVLASKWTLDRPFSNTFYAAVGGVTVSQLKSLEVAAINHMDFKLHISVRLYNTYLSEFKKQIAVPASSSTAAAAKASAAAAIAARPAACPATAVC